MKKLILMLATIGAFTFANAQQTAPAATGTKPAAVPAAAPAQTPAADPNAADIKWETKNIYFGKVAKGDENNSTRYFKFTNTGKSPLIISSCHGSCGCTVPSCPTEAILPGKAGEIKVHYDINRPGPFTKTVTVSSNAKESNVTLQITGVVEEKPATAPATPAPGQQK
jgi:NAD-dependent dihydropyrimidine dehydrogenase PreA subunit